MSSLVSELAALLDDPIVQHALPRQQELQTLDHGLPLERMLRD